MSQMVGITNFPINDGGLMQANFLSRSDSSMTGLNLDCFQSNKLEILLAIFDGTHQPGKATHLIVAKSLDKT